MQPLISVVCPVHNGGKFLPEAVSSILAQSHRNLELLLVDDHSTDGAVESLNVADDRLRVISCPERGVSHAFNAGLAQCQGQYVARMDADDIAMASRLERQLGLLIENPGIGIAGACVDFFTDGTVGQGNRVYRDWLNSLTQPDDIARAMFIESPIPNPTAMFRREIIERLGGYQHPGWPEDYDLFLRANAEGIKMAKPPDTLLHWRDHPSRLTRTDSRYSLENFQRAKLFYLAQGGLPERDLIIWGAGPTGKLTHDLLREYGAGVSGFIDVHPRRVGGRKRDKPVWEMAAALRPGVFTLVAVGARGARDEIRHYLATHDRVEGKDFLCVS